MTGRTSCTVWWGDVRSYGPWHDAMLDSVECGRRDRYVSPPDQARFAVGAALLRFVAGRLLGLAPQDVEIDRECRTCGRPHGKPRLGHGRPHVSVSHSGDCVAVAACPDAPVGIDVEQAETRADHHALAPEALSPVEVPAASATEFLRYWVRKEALVKATGDGLRIRLRDVIVTPPDAKPRLLSYAGRPGLAAGLRDLAGRPGYLAALASLTSSPLEVVELDATVLLSAPGTPAP